MNILHFGFEDHSRPGSGGGSFRNHQINARLAAAGHRVVVITAGYRGVRSRVEDGVCYRHIGLNRGYFTSLLTYQARLPIAVAEMRLRAAKPDLVVEEFAPPWSTLGINRWTSVPTVGMVQGYFAADKAREYHVSRRALVGLEKWGTRGHDHLIALSGELAAQLSHVAPAAKVSIVGMGIDHEQLQAALDPPPLARHRLIVFLGRLEVGQKGLDLLLNACDGILGPAGARLVLAGDGRDTKEVQKLVDRPGLRGYVDLPGRIGGREKWRLLAQAQISVVPSRYETFGLTALEALACGTPVVGFDIPCLRETIPRDAGRLLPPFEVDTLRSALQELLEVPDQCTRMGERGQRWAEGFSWDAVAAEQLAVYTSVVDDLGR